MEDCLFCKIASGELGTQPIYEDDKVFAFDDIDPQAPVHFLVIPKTHITSAAEIDEGSAALVGHIFAVIAEIARGKGIEANGYRVVTNIGKDGGQTVPHLHYHVLAGRELTWPPG